MTKKSIVTAILLSLFLIVVVYSLNRDIVSVNISSDQGVVVAEERAINHVIDFYVDRQGNYYYLDYYNTNTHMYKVTSTGEKVFKKKLPAVVKDNQNFYTKIVADDDGNIYVSVTVTSIGSRNIEKEWIQKYDAKGNYVANTYEMIPEEPTRMENPFSAFSSNVIQMQYVNDQIYIFNRKSKNEIRLIEIDIASGVLNRATEKKILEIDSSIMREIIYTEKDEIYFLNRHADIYRIKQDETVAKVDTTYNGYTRVIPHSISADAWGHVYFTDVYNKYVLKINQNTGRTEPVYPLNQYVEREKNLTLYDLRNLKMFDLEQLAGHTNFGVKEGNTFATFRGSGTASVVDQIRLSIPMALQTYGVWIALIFAGSFVTIVLGSLLSGRMGLVTKQILIFMPIFLIVMITMVFVFSTAAKKATIDASFEKIATVVEVTTKLMDTELFISLDMPKDDFGPEYNEIVRQVNVGDQIIYYITYIVEDGQIYVAVSNSVQSYTPVEFVYDKETVKRYYETLRTDTTQLDTTIDSLGEWMFALTPIRDANGQIVGILEHGVDASKVHEEITDMERRLTFFMIGFAIAVAIAYIIMLKYSMRALGVLKSSVAEVASGRWDAKVDIHTKDEFRDIGLAFNKMSDHIQEYIDEITKLNKAYVKFVPEEIFKLLGKKDILDITLGEQVMQSMSIVYINIRNINEHSKQMDMKENYEWINQILEIIAKKVNQNHGIVERFEGAGAIALFQDNADNALLASLRIMEELVQYNQIHSRQVEVGISINSGQVLLGIVGHENRMATTVISDEVNSTHALENIGAALGITLLLATSTVEQLSKLDSYSYRYVGRVQERNSTKTIEMYEFLDSYEPDVKKRKRMTRETLEEGIAFYQAGNFLEARKKFISVIRTDRNDPLAKTYLFLCEKHSLQEQSDWKGILEYF